MPPSRHRDPRAHRLVTAEGRRWLKERRRIRRFVPGATDWQMALLIRSLRKENYRVDALPPRN